MKKLLVNHEVRYIAENDSFAMYRDGKYTVGQTDLVGDAEKKGASVLSIKETDYLIQPDNRTDIHRFRETVAAVTRTKAIWKYA